MTRFGLSVTDVEERMAELEAQGYDTDKAFDMAVIEAGKAKLELLGSAAGTSAGGMKELAANIGDMVDALKIAVSDGIQPSVDALNILFDVANNGGDVISGIVDANIEQAQGVGDLVEQYKRLDAQLGLGSSFTGTSTDLRDNMEKVQAQILNTAGSVDEWTSALVAMGIANEWQISLHKESYAAAFEQAQVDKAAAAALEEYTRWTEANTAANKRMASQYSMTTTATEDLTMSVADMNYHQEEAYEGMVNSTAVLDANRAALAESKTAYDEARDAAKAFAEQQDEMTRLRTQDFLTAVNDTTTTLTQQPDDRLHHGGGWQRRGHRFMDGCHRRNEQNAVRGRHANAHHAREHESTSGTIRQRRNITRRFADGNG
ncbi:MAG: hypothetical protein IPH82_28880 [Chloroflexi bacterium]|nr:hypothetical protein [Chloroflexota bacterium]